MESLWKKSVILPKFEALKQDLETEVLIIGGGMAGLLCAYKLHNAGVNYALIEADTICNGVTANTTAKITAQHGIVYSKLIKKIGLENAKKYYTANQTAVEEYRKICENIDCDFETKSAYIYSLIADSQIGNEYSAMQSLGINAEFCQKIPLPFNVWGAVEIKNQAQFNPLKFARSIAENLNIYEHTKALCFNGEEIECENAKIKAKKIIVATHFPIFNKHGKYFLKLYQQRSYVIAYKNNMNINGMFLEARDNGISIRTSGEFLLVGGGGHRTGKNGGNWQEIEQFVKRNFKDCKEKYRWATQDCISLDGMPYIGEYAKGKSNLYAVTGFNKWGMTSSMVGANILTDLILSNRNEYSELFRPNRTILHPKLFTNTLETTVNLITPRKPRCPHLGCALKWNREERSWDCSCHGSRFAEDGKLLNNPATDDIKL